jgi:hypothetical protein
MLFEDKEKHPWSCDLSRGDTQCPFVTSRRDGFANCTWKAGHPDDLPHETVYSQPTPPRDKVWYLPG